MFLSISRGDTLLSTSRVAQLQQSEASIRMKELKALVGSSITDIAYQRLLFRWEPLYFQARTLDKLCLRYNTTTCPIQFKQTIDLILCFPAFNIKLRQFTADVAQYFPSVQ